MYVVSPLIPAHLEFFLPCQDRTILTYRFMGETHRTVHETFEEGQENSHDENTCQTCRARSDLDEPMRTVEDGPLPRHSDYEDDFSEAGLPRPSHDDEDEEDTYETTCIGIRDIIITGEVHHLFLRLPLADTDHFAQTDPNHGMAWGRFTFLGRVRRWDGMIALVRVPVRVPFPGDRARIQDDLVPILNQLFAG
jgi:hypothetical protein